MSDIFELDLRTIDPPSRKIIMPGGAEVIIQSPDVRELIELAKIGLRFKGVQTQELSEEDALKVIDEFSAALSRLIPEIKDHKLSFTHLVAIMEFMVSMAVPEDVKELARRGITPNEDGSEKKSLDIQESSPDSFTGTQDTPSPVS